MGEAIKKSARNAFEKAHDVFDNYVDAVTFGNNDKDPSLYALVTVGTIFAAACAYEVPMNAVNYMFDTNIPTVVGWELNR